MSRPGGARRSVGQTPQAPQPGQRSSQNPGLREVPATDQAIRHEVRPHRAATEIPTALTDVAGKAANEWRGGSDGR